MFALHRTIRNSSIVKKVAAAATNSTNLPLVMERVPSLVRTTSLNLREFSNKARMPECCTWGYNPDIASSTVIGADGKPQVVLSPVEWLKSYPDSGGKRQSPIALSQSDDDVTAVSTDAQSPLNIVENSAIMKLTSDVVNHTWHVVDGTNETLLSISNNYADPSITGLWKLIQFHFHTPAEHPIEGVLSESELHFVHQSVSRPDQLAVIGIVLQSETESFKVDGDISAVLTSLKDPETQWSVSDFYESFVKENSDSRMRYFHYPGSLTTPPCSEIVSWWVQDRVVTIPSVQMTGLKNAIADVPCSHHGINNRPVQEKHGRKIYYV